MFIKTINKPKFLDYRSKDVYSIILLCSLPSKVSIQNSKLTSVVWYSHMPKCITCKRYYRWLRSITPTTGEKNTPSLKWMYSILRIKKIPHEALQCSFHHYKTIFLKNNCLGHERLYIQYDAHGKNYLIEHGLSGFWYPLRKIHAITTNRFEQVILVFTSKRWLADQHFV